MSTSIKTISEKFNEMENWCDFDNANTNGTIFGGEPYTRNIPKLLCTIMNTARSPVKERT